MKIQQIQAPMPKAIKTSQKPTTDKEDQKLRESAKQLEGLFLSFLFKTMEKTIPKFDKKDHSNTLVSMMFSTVMGEDLAEKGGVGLAKFIYESMKDRQSENLKIPTADWVELISDKLISGRNHVK